MVIICEDWEILELALAEGEECRISGLKGDFRFLSNFFLAPMQVDRITYPTLEHAYQAAKTKNRIEKLTIAALPTPGSAKRCGVIPHPDWAAEKLHVMETLVEIKFRTHSDLCEKLIATGRSEIEETNTWGDQFWGVSAGVGENHLGLILMRVRNRLKNEAVT